MAKAKKPEQAILYQNFKGAIYGGTPEQVKNLMTAFCQYAFDGIETPSFGRFFLMVESRNGIERTAPVRRPVQKVSGGHFLVRGGFHRLQDADHRSVYAIDNIYQKMSDLIVCGSTERNLD